MKKRLHGHQLAIWKVYVQVFELFFKFEKMIVERALLPRKEFGRAGIGLTSCHKAVHRQLGVFQKYVL